MYGQFPARQKYDAYTGPIFGLSEGDYWGQGTSKHKSSNEDGELDLEVIICRLLQFPAHQGCLCYREWLDIYPDRSYV